MPARLRIRAHWIDDNHRSAVKWLRKIVWQWSNNRQIDVGRRPQMYLHEFLSYESTREMQSIGPWMTHVCCSSQSMTLGEQILSGATIDGCGRLRLPAYKILATKLCWRSWDAITSIWIGSTPIALPFSTSSPAACRMTSRQQGKNNTHVDMAFDHQ